MESFITRPRAPALIAPSGPWAQCETSIAEDRPIFIELYEVKNVPDILENKGVYMCSDAKILVL